ncbi:sulfurtransferase [Sporichthya brevicatena]|uniref:Sulfurtransferase n=1 Tax=Sporichthya brevicatena TaxID=171442 RepID=A0ABN1G8P9_9ACTN
MSDLLVDGAWLASRLGSDDLVVLDCSVTNVIHEGGGFELRSGREVWEQGHIPGSQHVDLLADLSDRNSPIPLMAPPVDQLRAALVAAGVADGRQVVLYDNNLNLWSTRVWFMLRAVSVDAVVLDGGWQSWTAQDRPVETGAGAPVVPGTLTLTPRPTLFVGKDDVRASLDDSSTCLIDALQAEVFRGERQDYARPGHIPGARNVPYPDLVDHETHRFLPLEELWAKFAHAQADSAERVITYCGGGVAASAAAFVLQRLGVENVSVYDGSMMEWSSDPELPLVTGES